MKTLGTALSLFWFSLLVCVLPIAGPAQSDSGSMDTKPFDMPTVGSYQLRVLSPTVLELVLINTKAPDPAQVTMWNFVGSSGQLNLPAASQFQVSADGRSIAIQSVGFKRRALHASLTPWPKTVNDRDLRIANSLFLTLASPVAEGETVQVLNPSGSVWPSTMTFTDIADPLRWSPAIHVNQVGYMPGQPKKAMVGYFMGSLGELAVGAGTSFRLADAASGATVYQGQLTLRADVGFNNPRPYQQVLQADFSAFNTPGEYVLAVPGLGASFPFLIHDGIAAAGTRAYALGLYHQRCGDDNSLPFTRHTHGACHTAPADVPTAAHPTWQFISQVTGNYATYQSAGTPQMTSLATCLYPYVRQGSVDVSGGHHDAGDYSKYTINSALMIHNLVFAADAFSGVGALDNLGIPESGDGKSDILQEAKHEADFLAKMVDTDGGVYFLVYPRSRKYENNVTPDNGDPQVVWPKTTQVTAAAVGALAEIASSPRFKQQYPAEAAMYLQKAQLGWNFLENAIAARGKDGSFQKITHYGISFGHNDELAWAAAGMFVATGDPKYHQKLIEWLPNPNDPNISRWTWWKLYEGYGAAVRDYAFAIRSGRLQAAQVDAAYLSKCENEVKSAGQALLQRSKDGAYGSSFSADNKRYMNAGWYFSLDSAYDMAAAYEIDPNPEYIDALIANMNYEMGCNPVNSMYVTGLGIKRQREIVHQHALNDIRILPPSGIPLGNIQTAFQYLDKYVTSSGGNELTALSYPPDTTSVSGSYALYDRWCDTWNVNTEFVVVNSARGLGATAFLMARSPLAAQSWSSAIPQITGLLPYSQVNQPLNLGVTLPGIPMAGATVVWEAHDQLPFLGPVFPFTPPNVGDQWVEVEVQLPDGRRSSAKSSINVVANTTLPIVSIMATDNSANEAGDPGTFTVTRTGSIASPLTVRYSIGGNATNGNDYDGLSGTIVIPAGAVSAAIALSPRSDSYTEPAETVILSLLADAAYTTAAPTSATATISDGGAPALPAVTVAATDSSASESGPDSGIFTISRSGSTASALTVNYAMSGSAANGSDYASLSGSVTIPAGASSAAIALNPVTDTQTESAESAILTILANAAYTVGSPSSATIAIADAGGPVLPSLSVLATDSNASEVGPDSGAFTISRSGSTASALTVNYAMSGSAANGSDYASLSGSVTIPAGASSAVVTLTPVADSQTEGAESAILTISANAAYTVGSPSSGTVSIADAGAPAGTVVTLAASDPTATEGGDNGAFMLSRTGSTTSALTVAYTMSGTATYNTDFTCSGTATIPAGASSSTVLVVPKTDSLNEGGETVTVTLRTGTGYTLGSPSAATVTIADPGQPTLPTVTVSAPDSSASENGDTGRFQVNRTGATTSALTVNVSLGGTAANGTDYNSLGTSVTIPAGASSASVTVTPRSDSLNESTETVIMTIGSNAAYTVGSPSSATVNIANASASLPTVTVSAPDSSASENGDTGRFQVNRTGATTSALTVNVSLGGTAANGTDYNSLGTSVTIPAGASSASVTVTPRSDSLNESTETVIMTIGSNAAYTVGSPSSATVNIANASASLPTVTVSADGTLAGEKGPISGNFIFTRSGSTSGALTVRYTMSGTATNGADYPALSGSIVIPAGIATVYLMVTPASDGIMEPAETVVLTLSANSAYTIGNPSSATIDIASDGGK